MSSKNNKSGSFIKKSYTNQIIFGHNKTVKKNEQKSPTAKRLTSLSIGVKSNALQVENKNNSEESTISKPAVTQKSKENEPPPETHGSYVKERIQILFGDFMDDDNLVIQFIKKTQNNMMKEYEKTNSFFKPNIDIYKKALFFKETICNYCIIIHLYLKRNEYQKALELFLLMCTKNREIIEYFYKKIKEQLPRITNANRIGKFFPLITNKFMQILSCLIKFSCKFCKSKLEHYFTQKYLEIIHIVSETVNKKFGAISNVAGIDNYIQRIGGYFYSNCIFDISIFFFIKYQPLILCTFILQHILELYKDKPFNDLLDVEQVLLLKVNYNLGLFLYVNGNNMEAINNLNQAKKRLYDIKELPLTNENIPHIITQNQNDTSNEFASTTIFSKLTHSNKRFGSFFNEKEKKSPKRCCLSKGNNNDGLMKNYYKNNSKEILDNSYFNCNNNFLRMSGRSALNTYMDSTLKMYSNSQQKNKAQINSEEESRGSLPRKSSGVLFGNQIMTLQQQCENIEEKIYNEIELMLGEIEFSQKNYSEAYKHLKKLLKKHKREKPFDRDKKKDVEQPKKLNNKEGGETNNCNFYLLSDSDKVKMMWLLEKIDQAYDKNNNENNYIDSEILKKSTHYYIVRNNTNIDGKKLINSKEMEKFFIFLCGLSVYQLKILNDNQPKPSKKRNDLPIIFNNQFKDCLTNKQRISLSLLESMSLSRYILLNKVNDDICPENLDFRFMKYRIKDTRIDNEKISKKFHLKKAKAINNSFSNSTHSPSLKIKPHFEEDKNTKKNFDKLVNNIKNEDNKDFIDFNKDAIFTLLNKLEKDEQKEYYDSIDKFKNLVNILKKGLSQTEEKDKK